jgi:hypothetical protein
VHHVRFPTIHRAAYSNIGHELPCLLVTYVILTTHRGEPHTGLEAIVAMLSLTFLGVIFLDFIFFWEGCT